MTTRFVLTLALLLGPAAFAQDIPAPMNVPQPGPVTDGPYAPQPILAGGTVIPLYAPDSPHLNQERVHEAEKYNMTRGVPGRIQSMVNVHNPSIEIHPADPDFNTGSVVILVPGGGHRTLVVGSEGSDPVRFFYNHGVNSVILRYRLRNDGYDARVDAVRDALQAIRLVRKHADHFGFDPKRIGIMGFSAGAELSAPAAIQYEQFDAENNDPSDPLAGISSRPDWVGLIYPGPTPFARGESPTIPRSAPPSFIATPGSGDRIHAIWAMEYFSAMLRLGVPNIEMHIYGNGTHGGAGKDRRGVPLGTWQYRLEDWMRDLGFLSEPGTDTKAAVDSAAFVTAPPIQERRRRGPGSRRRGPAN